LGLTEKVEKENIEKVNVEKIIKKENIEKENVEKENVEIENGVGGKYRKEIVEFDNKFSLTDNESILFLNIRMRM
jgi:hypothetical protein